MKYLGFVLCFLISGLSQASQEKLVFQEKQDVTLTEVSKKLTCKAGRFEHYEPSWLYLKAKLNSVFAREELTFEGKLGKPQAVGRLHCEERKRLADVAKQNGDTLKGELTRSVYEGASFGYHQGKAVLVKTLRTRYSLYFHLYAYLPFEADGADFVLEQLPIP